MEKEYEVIRLICQDAGCHIIMDCVKGELLGVYVTEHSKMEKEQLFSYLRQIIKQLDDLQKAKHRENYNCITPFFIVLRENGEARLLDLHAKSNQHLIEQIQKERNWNNFLEKKSQDNMLYSFGKTMQFLLAKTKLYPSLTKREERKLKKVISKCLSNYSRKRYQRFSEILLDFPPKRKKRNIQKKKYFIVLIMFFVLAGIGGGISCMSSKKQIVRQEETDSENLDRLEIGKTYFLELEDYKKSAEIFHHESNEKSLATVYEELALYMLGESEKTEMEIRNLLLKTEKKYGEKMDSMDMQILLESWNKLDSLESDQKCVELAEKILMCKDWRETDIDKKLETNVRLILGEAYEKTDQVELALKEYETVSKWKQSEEIYSTMIRLAEEIDLNRALKICEEAIKKNPMVTEFRIQYIRLLCRIPEVTKEMCMEGVYRMIQECPDLIENEEFQKLQGEYGIKIEGE